MEKINYVFIRVVITALQLILTVMIEGDKNSKETIQLAFNGWFNESVNFTNKLP